MSKYSIAYSPDTDDAFMVYAWRLGKIACPYDCEFFVDDIQKLNLKAKDASFDITAISFAAFPWLQTYYQLLPMGASVGRNFGPAVVVKDNSSVQSIQDLLNKKIAVPGFMTTAFLSAMNLLPQFVPVEKYFLDIGDAVKSEDVDAGILIHELQLNCEEHGFKKLGNLGTLWQEKFGLPLPLGANAIRKNIAEDVKKNLATTYSASINWALQTANRDNTVARASELAISGFNDEKAQKYIEMYVNNDSLDFSRDVLKACEILYRTAAEAKLAPAVDLAQGIYSFS